MKARKMARAGCLLLTATALTMAAARQTSVSVKVKAEESTIQMFSDVSDVEKLYKNNTEASDEYRSFTEKEWQDASHVTDNATLLYKFKNAVDANDRTALRLKIDVTNVYGLNNATIQLGLLNSMPEDSRTSSYISSQTGFAANEYALDSYGIRWEAAYSDWDAVLTNGEMTITLALNEETRYVFGRNSYNADYNYMKSVDTVGIRIIYPDLKDSRGAFVPKFTFALKSAEIVGNANAAEICGVKCDETRQKAVTLYNGNASAVKSTFEQQTPAAVSDYTEAMKPYGMNDAENTAALTLTNDFGTNTLSFVFTEAADISAFRKPALKIWMYLEGAVVDANDYHLQVGVFSSEDALASGTPYGDNLLDRYGVRIQKDGGREFAGAEEGWNAVVLPVLGDTSARYAGFNVNNELRTFNGQKLDGFAFRAHSGNAEYKWAVYSVEVVDLADYDSGTGVIETRPKSEAENTYSISAEATLELENEVYINYYFQVLTGTFEAAEATEGGIYISSSAFEDGEAAGAKKLAAVLVGEKYKARTEGIAAKEIGDSMWAQMYAVVGGETVKSAVYEYSPKIYAMNKLNGENVSDETKDLCLALLDYGAAAQNYFGYKTDAPANAEVPETIRAAVESYRSTVYTEKETYEKAAFSFGYPVEMSLTLDGAIALNCYVTTPDAGKVQIAVFDKAPDAADIANAERISMTATTDGKFVYTSEKPFAAKEIGDEKYFVIFVTEESGETVSSVIAYGGITYAMNKISGNTAGAAIKTLSKALLGYGAAAQNYFKYNDGNFANRYI